MLRRKLWSIFICLCLALSCTLSLVSCGDEEEPYTNGDIDTLIAQLEASLTEKTTKNETALAALKAEYSAKIAELEADISGNQAELEALTADYDAKVAELEAADTANTEALAALRGEYEADLAELQAADAANATAIEELNADYDAKVAELEAADTANTEALAALSSEYEADLAELQAADAANATAIEELNADYDAKVAELEAADTANTEALASLRNEYEAEAASLNALISANTEKIEQFKSELQTNIDNLNSKHDAAVESITSLITALQEADSESEARIAELEAKVAELIELNTHDFGEWVDYIGNAEVYCENRLFYRICSECNIIEWKGGSYDNHTFETVTTEPTCTAVGYDTKTCTICGKVEIVNETEMIPHPYNTVTTPPTCVSTGYDTMTCTACGDVQIVNETPISDHTWAEVFSYDNSFHWYDCDYCDATKDNAEHTTDDSGYCTVCDMPVGATEGVIYEVSVDGTYAEVVGYGGSATKIIIADTYENLPVKNIYEGVFNNHSIVSVVIPDSVTTISNSAFYNCDSLRTVVLGAGVEIIEDSAFYDCDALLNIVIPDATNSIDAFSFYGCSSLEDVKMGSGVTYIGERAFYNCDSLVSVELGSSLESIASEAFEDCDALTDIVIPDSVTTIGNDAFYSCYRLASVHIGSGVKTIASNAFRECDSLTDVIIPDSVESIGNYAFQGCAGLRSVVIGSGVKTIGSSAFSGCSSLSGVTFKSGASEIASGAFSSCNSALYTTYEFGKYVGNADNPYAVLIEISNKNLRTYNINENTMAIAYGVFSGCERLVEILIPDSVQGISSSAFTSCPNLSAIYYESGFEEWKTLESTAPVSTKIMYFYSEEDPMSQGNFWHYVDGAPTIWESSFVSENYTRDGEYVYFGEYPQSIKADDVTITETQDARGYYLGSDGNYYAKVVARPFGSSYKFSNDATVTYGTTYYFKVEPIRWRILTVEGDSALILCDSIIANHRYDDSRNNYKDSEIRQWLNATFYETAFSGLQREIILTTTVDNSVYSTGYDPNPYACEDTEDKLFLLSYREATNSDYGFASSYRSDTAREMETTDYTRATGAYMSTDSSYYGNGYWWLRSPSYSHDHCAWMVGHGGDAYTASVDYQYNGVVPALWIRL